MDKHGFQTITATDHRAWLWVASLLSLVYSMLCLGARLTGKWEMLLYEDAVLAGAYVFALAHYGTLFNALYTGLGVSSLILTAEDIAISAKYYFSSRILGFLALCLSKVSVLIMMRRIFAGASNRHKEKPIFAITDLLFALYGICAVLLPSVGCRPEQTLALGINAACAGNIARWTVVTTLDVTSETVLLMLPIYFLSRNTLPASKKGVVISAFAFRLAVAAFSIASTVTYFEYLNGNNLNIGIASTIVWQETLLGFSLISASIPCLKVFMWAFTSTRLRTTLGDTTTGGSGVTGTQRTQDRSLVQSKNRDDIEQQLQYRLRPDTQGHITHIQSQHNIDKKTSRQDSIRERGSVNSFGSERGILRTT